MDRIDRIFRILLLEFQTARGRGRSRLRPYKRSGLVLYPGDPDLSGRGPRPYMRTDYGLFFFLVIIIPPDPQFRSEERRVGEEC